MEFVGIGNEGKKLVGFGCDGTSVNIAARGLLVPCSLTRAFSERCSERHTLPSDQRDAITCLLRIRELS